MAKDANPKHPWLYVAGYKDSVIAIYDLGKFGVPQIGAIVDGIQGPAGLALDASGSLYVANYTGADVTIYAPQAKVPMLTLAQGLDVPTGVAVDTNGDVYVTNRGGSPSIQVYAQGQTSPYATITSNLIQLPNQVLFDSSRNLYMDDDDTGVAKMPLGSQQPASLNLQGLNEPSGIALDSKGYLFVTNLGNQEMLEYAPGSTAPARQLNLGRYVNFLSSGTVNRRDYIFAPESTEDALDIMRVNAGKPLLVLPVVEDPYGVAYKPAGVP
jgi:DNA-binding beta-propeller fold protein YncE